MGPTLQKSTTRVAPGTDDGRASRSTALVAGCPP